jgi:hypothetical protein
VKAEEGLKGGRRWTGDMDLLWAPESTGIAVVDLGGTADLWLGLNIVDAVAVAADDGKGHLGSSVAV